MLEAIPHLRRHVFRGEFQHPIGLKGIPAIAPTFRSGYQNNGGRWVLTQKMADRV